MALRFTFFVLESDKSKIVFYLSLPNQPKYLSRWLSDISDRLNHWISTTRMETGVALSIGIGKLQEDSFQHVSLHYEQAQSALSRKFFEGVGKVIIYEPAEGRTTPGYDLLEKEPLLAAAIKEDVVHLILQAAQRIKHLLPEEKYGLMLSGFRDELMACRDYKELRQRTKQVLQELMKHYGEPEQDPNLTVVHQCQAYIVTGQMYVTGGIGSMAHKETFTLDYDLPNDTVYAETCASIGLIFFAQRMLRLERKDSMPM